MSLKILYNGSSAEFLKRMGAFADTLPDLVRRLDGLKLQKCYTGVKSVRFLEKPINGEKAFYDPSKDEIIVHPTNFTAGDRIDYMLFKALGKRHWALNMSSSDRIRWANMYAFARKPLIERLATVLNGSIQFKDVISKFSTAVDKLVVIHILNALTKNSITPSQLQTTDFRKHSSVKDFVDGRKPYSLKPLMSAYGGDTKKLADYPACFAEWCVNRGDFRISETSTKEEFKDLFKEVSSPS